MMKKALALVAYRLNKNIWKVLTAMNKKKKTLRFFPMVLGGYLLELSSGLSVSPRQDGFVGFICAAFEAPLVSPPPPPFGFYLLEV